MSQTVAFKRLVIGAKFTVAKEQSGQVFKKIAGQRVVKINANGTGHTHNQIPFTTGNTACVVVN